MILSTFKNLNSISNIFQETQSLSFDGPSNYLYLFKNYQQTFLLPGERPSFHLKVTKMWFCPTLITFWNPSLQTLLPVTHLLSLIKLHATNLNFEKIWRPPIFQITFVRLLLLFRELTQKVSLNIFIYDRIWGKYVLRCFP